MTDVLTPEQRRKNMASIRSRNTKPEKIVRLLLHKLGYHFKLHSQKLPGKPDIVFPNTGKIIFIHGCFWHMHSCKYGRVVPKTNAEFWKNKRLLNRQRDEKILRKLKRQGWQVLVVWECQLKSSGKLAQRLNKFLAVRNKQLWLNSPMTRKKGI